MPLLARTFLMELRKSRRLGAAVLAVLVSGVLIAPAAAGTAVQGDPLEGQQWGLRSIGTPAAWKVARGRGAVVAVVDTGIDLTHPDLKGRLLPGRNYVNPRLPPQDDNGHGTHVAGIIAATGRNGIGITGVAPEARLIPIKVADASGVATAEAIAAGIRYGADRKAQIINVSLAGSFAGEQIDTLPAPTFQVLGDSRPIRDAVAYAQSHGSLVMAAAGNGRAPLCSSPAVYAALCVGALREDDTRATYSQGNGVSNANFLMAPGGEAITSDQSNASSVVLSTVSRGTALDSRRTGYGLDFGTSMATPHVAGVAALLVSRGLKVSQIVDKLLSTATDLGPPGPDAVFGRGKVDAASALTR
jgi:subtilisin family serine protease